MSLRFASCLIALSLAAAACSDPRCDPNEAHQGSLCVALEREAGPASAVSPGPESDAALAPIARMDGGPSNRQDARPPLPVPQDGGGGACDSADGGRPCAPTEVCKGAANQTVCDGAQLYGCDDQGTATRKDTCASARHCRPSSAGGSASCAVCLPGEHKCDAKNLLECNDDGSGWNLKQECATAGLCNAEAHACTDQACVPDAYRCNGLELQQCSSDLLVPAYQMVEVCAADLCDATNGQCDKCVPGVTSCDRNFVRTCDPTGQTQVRTACPTPTSKCTGAGKCVQCVSDPDCPATKECTAPSCKTSVGTCETRNLATHTECSQGVSQGVCDGNGTCVGCVDGSDCPSTAPQCSAGKCVQCTSNAQCDATAHQTCDRGKCITSPYCGDGVVTAPEACDDSPGNIWTCKDCKKRTLYNVCTPRGTDAASFNADCSAGEACIVDPDQPSGYCSVQCMEGLCPRPLTGGAICISFICNVTCLDDLDCPPGLFCERAGDLNRCQVR